MPLGGTCLAVPTARASVEGGIPRLGGRWGRGGQATVASKLVFRSQVIGEPWGGIRLRRGLSGGTRPRPLPSPPGKAGSTPRPVHVLQRCGSPPTGCPLGGRCHGRRPFVRFLLSLPGAHRPLLTSRNTEKSLAPLGRPGARPSWVTSAWPGSQPCELVHVLEIPSSCGHSWRAVFRE